ncbi:MAG: GGDEF domain-containing protein [Burkholderiales bacterium]|nr:GGDEF domain-containing protein [Burkholderiales bacterium]
MGYLLRFELAALLAGLLSLAVSPYLAAAVLAGVAVSLIAKVARLQRQQGALQREIATLVRNTQHLKDQAYTDTLTGLANRLLLTDRFQQTVERAKRNRTQFALLMVDLDAFKAINDHYGHAAGDFVLQTVAQRLLAAVRASDTVARLGGDEFVLIIDRFEEPDELVRIGRKLIATISDDIVLPDGEVVSVGASIGFALYPRNGTDINDLLHVADKGMYDCKISGLMELQ